VREASVADPRSRRNIPNERLKKALVWYPHGAKESQDVGPLLTQTKDLSTGRPREAPKLGPKAEVETRRDVFGYVQPPLQHQKCPEKTLSATLVEGESIKEPLLLGTSADPAPLPDGHGFDELMVVALQKISKLLQRSDRQVAPTEKAHISYVDSEGLERQQAVHCSLNKRKFAPPTLDPFRKKHSPASGK
jgi:hypothetical protein